MSRKAYYKKFSKTLDKSKKQMYNKLIFYERKVNSMTFAVYFHNSTSTVYHNERSLPALP